MTSFDSSMPSSLLWMLLAFFFGSLPFSVWLPKLIRREDVRRYGDHNPGATNAFRAGGAGVGLAALLLDISKAAAPVGWAYFQAGITGWPMLLIATAPVLGHAFSPFLRFRGGKALAVAFGVWIGLTLWKLSLPALLLVLIWRKIIDVDGWAVMLALAVLLGIILLWLPAPLFVAVGLGQMIILGWKHQNDLRRRPHLRPWVARHFSH
ncbi:MAG: glycerol-3-phosphate acyltransferase [Anaerolineae bacterium]|nr:glycerol-3-phosphate acyltransferase [Anaerolineae bacterium]